MRPADEWGEMVKIIVDYIKYNISTTTHWFQTVITAFERSTSVKGLKLFDHCNTSSINDDMTILTSMIATQLEAELLFVVRNAITQQPLIRFSL
jgi:LPS sulfotransferase NodH